MSEYSQPTDSASVMFGRGEEIDALTEILDASFSGNGQVVLLPGDAGIGKTRLVEQLASSATGHGALTLWGFCRAGAGTPPFWPWRQVAREIRRSTNSRALHSAITQAGVQVAEVFPELNDLLPAEKSKDEPGFEQDVANNRFRSLDAASTWLTAVVELQPALIILEDLHWADQATLDLLEFVSAKSNNHNLMIASTYREKELEEDHPVHSAIRSLLRLPNVSRNPVAGIEPDQARRLIGYYSSYTFPEETVASVVEQAEGNPFYMTEMIKEIVDSSASELPRLPSSVREAIWRRLDRMDERTVRVLTVVAAFGRPVTEQDLLGASPDMDRSILWSALEDSIRMRELQEISGPIRRYDFVHALIPRTLLESVGAPALRTIHARIGTAMERRVSNSADELLPEIAHHYVEAGTALDPLRTARHAIAAGEHALDANAFADAVPWFEAALGLLDGRSDQTRLLADAHAGMGRALAPLSFDVVGQQDAWNHLSAAFSYYSSSGQTEQAISVAGEEFAFGSLEGAADMLKKAVVFSVGGPRHGWLLTRYAIALLDDEREIELSLEYLNQANIIADQSDDYQLKAFVELRLSQHYSRCGDLLSAIEHGRIADELADNLEILSITARQLGWIGLDGLLVGNPDLSKSITDKGLNVANRLNDQRWRYWGLKSQLKRELFVGDWNAAELTIAFMEEVSGITAETKWFRAALDCETGARSAVEILRNHGLGDVQDEPFDRSITTLSVRILDRVSIQVVEQEFLESTGAAIRSAIDSLPPRFPPSIDGHFMIQAYLDLLSRDALGVESKYNAITKSSTRMELGTGSTDRLLARLSESWTSAESVVSHYGAALGFCKDAGYWPEFAYTCHDYAKFLIEHRPSDPQITQLLTEGFETATRLGMKPLVEVMTGLRSDVPNIEPTRKENSTLSDRQIEVLKLIARGDSNRQIADELVISPNTVARHVANIYEKLGSSNRVTLAAYAKEHGIE